MSNGIEQLLEELRLAGPKPKRKLLEAIRALGAEAVPALVAMVTDPKEYEPAEDDDADVAGWAPYAAVKILGELHPLEALEPLLLLLTWDDYDYLDGTVPRALGHFGSSAVEPLGAILANSSHSVWTRGSAAEALGVIARREPELRDEVVLMLTVQLDTVEPECADLDILQGSLVSELVELEAQESVPSIVRAFDEERVDTMVSPWSHVRDNLDIPTEDATRLDQEYPRIRLPFSDFEFPTLTSQPEEPLDSAPQPPYQRATPKVGRNEPCPCGSGKKYKKCHGG